MPSLKAGTILARTNLLVQFADFRAAVQARFTGNMDFRKLNYQIGAQTRFCRLIALFLALVGHNALFYNDSLPSDPGIYTLLSHIFV